MTQEEKAKAYDEAIERAKSKIKNNKDHVLYEDDVIEIFPELMGSDDERIIKAIKSAVLQLTDIYLQEKYGLKQSDCIAWLEKQGEHANFRNKIKIGDKVTRNEDGVLVNLSQLKRVAKKDAKQGEQKPLGFNIGDEITVNGQICKVVAVEQKPAEWSSEQSNTLQTDNVPYESSPNAHLWTRAIGFDGESMESKPCEQKSSWSEEDEKMLEYAINMIEWYSVVDKRKSRLVSAWLKSLKERYTWKPSEGQLECLGYAIDKAEKDWSPLTNNRIYLTLKALKEQLLELRGSKV